MSSSTDPSPPSNPESSPVPQSPGATSAASHLVPAQPLAFPSSKWLAARLLIAAVVSAVLGGVFVQHFGSLYKIPAELTSGITQFATPEQLANVNVATRVRDSKNLYVTFVLLGTILGLSFGAAAASAHRSRWRLGVGLAGGVVLGGLLGAAAAEAVGYVGARLSGVAALEADLAKLLTHATGWAIIGFGVGLGASLASGYRRAMARGALAAFAGGLIGGALYVPLVAVLIPSLDTAELVPAPIAAVLLWIALPALFIALGLARALGHGTAKAPVEGGFA